MKETPEMLFEKLDRDEYYNETNLSIFWHLATFNSAMRAYEYNEKTCNCGQYEKSMNEKTPFFCSEDKLIRSEDAYNLILKITDNVILSDEKFTPVETLKYLKSTNKLLQASEIDHILNSEFEDYWKNKLTMEERNQILENYNIISSDDKSFLLSLCYLYGASSGGDCGCCGNYSGPCFYCHIGCYIHDIGCEDCGYGCGWACVPGPC